MYLHSEGRTIFQSLWWRRKKTYGLLFQERSQYQSSGSTQYRPPPWLLVSGKVRGYFPPTELNAIKPRAEGPSPGRIRSVIVVVLSPHACLFCFILIFFIIIFLFVERT